jgi:hypothetical protein
MRRGTRLVSCEAYPGMRCRGHVEPHHPLIYDGRRPGHSIQASLTRTACACWTRATSPHASSSPSTRWACTGAHTHTQHRTPPCLPACLPASLSACLPRHDDDENTHHHRPQLREEKKSALWVKVHLLNGHLLGILGTNGFRCVGGTPTPALAPVCAVCERVGRTHAAAAAPTVYLCNLVCMCMPLTTCQLPPRGRPARHAEPLAGPPLREQDPALRHAPGRGE